MIEYSTVERNTLLDEFITPQALVEACFEQAIVPIYDGRSSPRRILDVGANTGRWGTEARKHFPAAEIIGVEMMNISPLPRGYDLYMIADFMKVTFSGPFDLIIGNPPFRVRDKEDNIIYKAEDFVRKAISHLTPDGHLAFLLRANFRHSIERYWLDRAKRTQPGLFQTHLMYQVWDCTMRPSFYKEDERTEQYGTKATNAHDYALFMWWKSWQENYYIGKHLDWKYED